MKLSIIIPTYNEEKTLKKVVQETLRAFTEPDLLTRSVSKSFDFEIIIVDDGSTDNTPNILSNTKDDRVHLIKHLQNFGKGRAIRSGLQVATGDFVAIQDADLEYKPETLHTLYGHLISTECVVYGKRSGDVGYILNRFGNKVLSFVCNMLFHSNLSDIYTCYKIIPRKIMQELDLQSNGFEIEAEITAKILKRKFHIIEIPIDYNPRTFSEGKKINWRDGLRGIITLVVVSIK